MKLQLQPLTEDPAEPGIESANPVLRAAGVKGRVTASGGVGFNLNELRDGPRHSVGRSLFVLPTQFSVQVASRATKQSNPENPSSKYFGLWTKDVAYTASVRKRVKGELSFNIYQHSKGSGLQNITSDPRKALVIMQSNAPRLAEAFVEEARLLAQRNALPWLQLPDEAREVILAKTEETAARARRLYSAEVETAAAELLSNTYPGLFHGVAPMRLWDTLELQVEANADLYPLFRLPNRATMLKRLLAADATPDNVDELDQLLNYERLLVAYLFRSTMPSATLLAGLRSVKEEHGMLQHSGLYGVAPEGYELLRSRIWHAPADTQRDLFESLIEAYSTPELATLRNDTLQRLQQQLRKAHPSGAKLSRWTLPMGKGQTLSLERVASNPWYVLSEQAGEAVDVQRTKERQAEADGYDGFLKVLQQRFLMNADAEQEKPEGYGLWVEAKHRTRLVLNDTLGGTVDLLEADRSVSGLEEVLLLGPLTNQVYRGATAVQQALDSAKSMGRTVMVKQGRRQIPQRQYAWAEATTLFTDIADAIERSLRANAVKPTPEIVLHAFTALIVGTQRGKRSVEDEETGLRSLHRRNIPRNFWRACGELRFDAEHLLWGLDGDTDPEVLRGMLGQPKDFLRQLLGSPVPGTARITQLF